MTQNTSIKMTNDSQDSGEKADRVTSLKEEIASLREGLEEERDRYLRLAAEYKNYRRRTEQGNNTAADEGKREILIQLISLADDLDLALAGLNESPDAVVEGLRMIHRRFRDILEANKVIAFESEGERFDPERHEAFAVVTDGKRESGIVQKEMRRGYFWKDKLFRPALVVVEQ